MEIMKVKKPRSRKCTPMRADSRGGGRYSSIERDREDDYVRIGQECRSSSYVDTQRYSYIEDIGADVL